MLGRNSPFEGGRALKICPVGKFSEGASLRGGGDVILNKEPETIFTSDFGLRTSVFFNIVTNNKSDI